MYVVTVSNRNGEKEFPANSNESLIELGQVIFGSFTMVKDSDVRIKIERNS